ncbi:hypothetical protein HMPREF0043_00164 [Actinobaculum sp. oral taxon 183 str. F0552]|nr:hypothetical protein HMPREF0043_00164 [Actinobaculum sp. oral taxon 183 str. F0552]
MDDDDIAGNDLFGEDQFDSSLLRFDDAGRAFEMKQRLIYTRGFDHCAVFSQISKKDRKTAVCSVCVSDVADASIDRIFVRAIPA